MPKNVGYLFRGFFLIILGILWVLYDQGSIKNLIQLAGSLLVIFGTSVVLVSLLTIAMGREGVAQ